MSTQQRPVIIVGCGGREHAIVNAIRKQNPFVKLYCIGVWENPGIQQWTTKYVCAPHWMQGFGMLSRELLPTTTTVEPLVVVGPEKPLSEGIVDWVKKNAQMKCVGPTQAYAQVETSKIFLRKLMTENAFLTKHAPYWVQCRNPQETCDAIDRFYENRIPVVIKPDGLTSGKGVQVQDVDFVTATAAKDYVRSLHGSTRILLEQRLKGREFTLMSFCDGKTCKHMPVVQDFKRLNDGNRGPNTGGMGSVSFAGGRPDFLSAFDLQCARRINETVFAELNRKLRRAEHEGYKGILYGSFMKTAKDVMVIEYNARFGDPEVMNVLSHLRTNLLTIFDAIVNGYLDRLTIEWDLSFNTVVKYLVPAAYPESHHRMGHLRLKLHRPSLPIVMEPEILLAGVHSKQYHEHQYALTGSRSLAMIKRGTASHQELERELNGHFQLFDETDVTFREHLFASESDNDSDDSDSDSDDNHNCSSHSRDSYSAAGVNIDRANRAVKAIETAVTSTWDPQKVKGKFGDFGGCFRLSDDQELVASTDGVGTKSQLVLRVLGPAKGYESLGQDIVNHCVNDILVQFARPLFFLDYVGVPTIEPENLKHLVTGMAKACQQVHCAILGGETAEMPSIYRPETCDIVGTMVGRKVPSKIQPVRVNDAVIGVRSSGPHTNGYTLIRKLLETLELDDETILESGFCNIHRCYLPHFERLLRAGIVPHAMCHITGGGFEDNPPRVLPANLTIQFREWQFPEPFRSLQEHLSRQEMMRTFNCGIGFLFIVSPDQAPKVMKILGTDDCFRCGTVVER
jgi:phosphoribosylamine--glycine ligase/phosphoribosylaminoimidazole synthetase